MTLRERRSRRAGTAMTLATSLHAKAVGTSCEVWGAGGVTRWLTLLRGSYPKPLVHFQVADRLALVGGVLAGFAARLARGCTSGQGLVGGAELSVGAWVFLMCIFAGGWMVAWFVRKQWI